MRGVGRRASHGLPLRSFACPDALLPSGHLGMPQLWVRAQAATAFKGDAERWRSAGSRWGQPEMYRSFGIRTSKPKPKACESWSLGGSPGLRQDPQYHTNQPDRQKIMQMQHLSVVMISSEKFDQPD